MRNMVISRGSTHVLRVARQCPALLSRQTILHPVHRIRIRGFQYHADMTFYHLVPSEVHVEHVAELIKYVHFVLYFLRKTFKEAELLSPFSMTSHRCSIQEI